MIIFLILYFNNSGDLIFFIGFQQFTNAKHPNKKTKYF